MHRKHHVIFPKPFGLRPFKVSSVGRNTLRCRHQAAFLTGGP
jgi:hypothetical protein